MTEDAASRRFAFSSISSPLNLVARSRRETVYIVTKMNMDVVEGSATAGAAEQGNSLWVFESQASIVKAVV
jgi:hypothetical protein